MNVRRDKDSHFLHTGRKIFTTTLLKINFPTTAAGNTKHSTTRLFLVSHRSIKIDSVRCLVLLYQVYLLIYNIIRTVKEKVSKNQIIFLCKKFIKAFMILVWDNIEIVLFCEMSSLFADFFFTSVHMLFLSSVRPT